MIAITTFAIFFTSTVIYLTKWCVGKKMNLSGKTVLITGCDSGFGLATALRLHDMGLKLIVTCLSEESVGSKQLRKFKNINVYILNLCGTNELKNFILQIKADYKNGIWALINNAGIGTPGELLYVSDSLTKKIFQINFFAPLNLISGFLPLIIKGEF